jgi:hypothetical protein
LVDPIIVVVIIEEGGGVGGVNDVGDAAE